MTSSTLSNDSYLDLGMSGYVTEKNGLLFANNGDPDQMPCSRCRGNTASDLGLHCLPVTSLGVSRLQWVN